MNDAQAELLGLLAEEFGEGGLVVHVVPAGGELPAQLVMPIDSGRSGRNLRIQVYFLPQVDDPPVLQYFVTLPYQLRREAMPTLARLLCALNASLPVTGFELSEPNRVVVFRHTHAINVQPLDPGVIAWTLTMIRSATQGFGDLVEAVAGGLDLTTALIRLDRKLAELLEP